MMKKTSRIHMPIYNDGLFEVFEIIEDDSVQANTSLQSKDISMTLDCQAKFSLIRACCTLFVNVYLSLVNTNLICSFRLS